MGALFRRLTDKTSRSAVRPQAYLCTPLATDWPRVPQPDRALSPAVPAHPLGTCAHRASSAQVLRPVCWEPRGGSGNGWGAIPISHRSHPGCGCCRKGPPRGEAGQGLQGEASVWLVSAETRGGKEAALRKQRLQTRRGLPAWGRAAWAGQAASYHRPFVIVLNLYKHLRSLRKQNSFYPVLKNAPQGLHSGIEFEFLVAGTIYI